MNVMYGISSATGCDSDLSPSGRDVSESIRVETGRFTSSIHV